MKKQIIARRILSRTVNSEMKRRREEEPKKPVKEGPGKGPEKPVLKRPEERVK